MQLNAQMTLRAGFNTPAVARQGRAQNAGRAAAAAPQMRASMSAQINIRDGFSQVGGNAFMRGGAGGAMGLGNLDNFLTSYYPGAGVGVQVSGFSGIGGLNQSIEFAASMGAINPAQLARLNGMTGALTAFAGGFGVNVNVNVGNYLDGMLAYSAMQQQAGWLSGLQYGQDMLSARLGYAEANYAQFQGLVQGQMAQVGEQLGFYGGQIAQLQQGMGIYGEQIAANTNGIGQLFGQVNELNANLGGLGGVVSGIDSKLGSLSASTDARFAGVGSEMQSIMSQIADLRAELKAARDENKELRTKIGSEASRLDTRIDSESAARSSADAALGSRISAETSNRQSAVTDLRGQIASLDTRMQTADTALRAQLEAQKKELQAKLDAETSARSAADAGLGGRIDAESSTRQAEAAAIRAQIGDLDTRMQTADAALKAQLEAQKKELEGKLSTLSTRVETGFAELNSRIDSAVSTINAKIDSEVSRLDAADAAIRTDLQAFREDYNKSMSSIKEQFSAQDARIDAAFQNIQAAREDLSRQLGELDQRMQSADANLQAQLNVQRQDITAAQARLDSQQAQLTEQRGLINGLRTDVNTSIQIGVQALNEARGAQASANAANAAAANLQNQVNGLSQRIDQTNVIINNVNVTINQRITNLDQRFVRIPPPPPPPPPRPRDPIILDLANNGIDIAGNARTGLLGEPAASFNWTKKGTDDAFAIVDADNLRKMGWEVQNADGSRVDGNTLFRDGLRITPPGGQTVTINDGWQMLNLFDSNKDGKVDKHDPAWGAMKLFIDKNADGTMDRNEIRAMESGGVASIGTQGGSFLRDGLGNLRSEGAFTTVQGETRRAVDAFLGQRG